MLQSSSRIMVVSAIFSATLVHRNTDGLLELHSDCSAHTVCFVQCLLLRSLASELANSG